MIIKKDTKWYLDEPTRLLQKKPFTRGGDLLTDCNQTVSMSTKSQVDFSRLNLYKITQDEYIQEYTPSLHRIIYNKSIPHISVRVGSNVVSIDKMTMTAAYEKIIHAAHTLHLTANPMDFTLCGTNKDNKKNWIGKIMDALSLKNNPEEDEDDAASRFQEVKQEWLLRGMESVKYDVISAQKKLADVGLLFSYNKEDNKLTTKVYSYDDGYIVIPEYNELGIEIGASLYYKTDDGTTIIDFYDNVNHYRIYSGFNDESDSDGWIIEDGNPHGFSTCPLLYKRGTVAWEYAESTIQMWELMSNINAVALKRFGTFGLVLTGEMDEKSFQRDASTLIINLSSNTSAGKQDAKVIEFPEPQKMIEYLNELETKISIFSSVSFITPKDITSTGSGGNGIFLAMKNDLALATQSVADWAPFTNAMIRLFQEGLSLESNSTNKYNDLRISAKLKPWSMESETTKITNLAMESKWLSRESIVEKSPDAAPDEMERIANEKRLDIATNINNQSQVNANADKATNIATNNSSVTTEGDIVDSSSDTTKQNI